MTAPKYEHKSFVPPGRIAPCSHPQAKLIQMHQHVCDPDLVTVCTACGVAFPGQTIENLTIA